MYYSLKQRKISLRQLHALMNEVEVACYQMERLYAYKCWFRGSYSVNDKVIKMHMTLHFIYEIIETGCTENTNVVIYENLHIVVAKEPFKCGSKRTRNMLKEIYERIEKRRLLNVICTRYKELQASSMRLDMNPVDVITTQREPFVVYRTKPPNVVTYKFSSERGNSERLYYNRTANKLQTFTDREPVHKSPVVPLSFMWYDLLRCESASTFLRRFKRGDKGK